MLLGKWKRMRNVKVNHIPIVTCVSTADDTSCTIQITHNTHVVNTIQESMISLLSVDLRFSAYCHRFKCYLMLTHVRLDCGFLSMTYKAFENQHTYSIKNNFIGTDTTPQVKYSPWVGILSVKTILNSNYQHYNQQQNPL